YHSPSRALQCSGVANAPALTMAIASCLSNAIITSASRSPFELGSDHAALACVITRKGFVETTVPSPSQQPEYAHSEKLPVELNASDIGVKSPSSVSALHVPLTHCTSTSLRQFHTSACSCPKNAASAATLKLDQRVRLTIAPGRAALLQARGVGARMQPSGRRQPLDDRGLPAGARHQEEAVLALLEQSHFHRHARMPQRFVVTKAVADVHELIVGGVKQQRRRGSLAHLQLTGESPNLLVGRSGAQQRFA